MTMFVCLFVTIFVILSVTIITEKTVILSPCNCQSRLTVDGSVIIPLHSLGGSTLQWLAGRDMMCTSGTDHVLCCAVFD